MSQSKVLEDAFGKVSHTDKEAIILISKGYGKACRKLARDTHLKIGRIDEVSTTMDLVVVHTKTPLNLVGMLTELADETKTPVNAMHDIAGIGRYLDRGTGELTECFSPRYAMKEEKPAEEPHA